MLASSDTDSSLRIYRPSYKSYMLEDVKIAGGPVTVVFVTKPGMQLSILRIVVKPCRIKVPLQCLYKVLVCYVVIMLSS